MLDVYDVTGPSCQCKGTFSSLNGRRFDVSNRIYELPMAPSEELLQWRFFPYYKTVRKPLDCKLDNLAKPAIWDVRSTSKRSRDSANSSQNSRGKAFVEAPLTGGYSRHLQKPSDTFHSAGTDWKPRDRDRRLRDTVRRHSFNRWYSEHQLLMSPWRIQSLS